MELCQGEGTASISFSASGGGTGGSTTTTASTTTSSSSTSTTSGQKTLALRARGTSGAEQVNLRFDSATIATWTLSTSMATRTATTYNSGGINVQYFNDASGRDVYVDYLVVNGSTRQAESQSYNTAVWQNSSCGGSNSEWLHCNGYIGFGDVSGGGTSTTTTSATTTTIGGTTTTSGGESAPCSNPSSISAPFNQNGSGTYCFALTSCNYINSWNLAELNINGVNLTNKYVSASNMPAKIDGVWVIKYVGNYSWSHFEAR